MDLSWF
jgi:hypothetical protein